MDQVWTTGACARARARSVSSPRPEHPGSATRASPHARGGPQALTALRPTAANTQACATALRSVLDEGRPLVLGGFFGVEPSLTRSHGRSRRAA